MLHLHCAKVMHCRRVSLIVLPLSAHCYLLTYFGCFDANIE